MLCFANWKQVVFPWRSSADAGGWITARWRHGGARPADLRRGFEGLATLVRESLHEDERSSQLFVFTNRRHDRIRILYWDGTGLWVMTKRLEQGTFAWPKIPEGAAQIRLRPEALEMLLAGIDLKGARLRPWYEDPAAAGTGAAS